MQKAAELFAELGDSVRAVKAHLATLDKDKLGGLIDRLPANLSAGSAEMVMLVLLDREIRSRESSDGKIIPFRTDIE